MRSISASLEAEQQKKSATPYLKLTFESLGYLVEDCEDAWTASANVTCTADTDRCMGDYSAKQAIDAAFGSGLVAYEDFAAIDISGYSHLSLWIKTTRAFAAGELQILLDNSPGCASPLETLNVPAIGGFTWYRIHLTLSNPSLLTAVVSAGLKTTIDPGACDIYLDDLRATVVNEYTTKDATNRIGSIPNHVETPYDGYATITLKNADQVFNAKDLRGNRLWIKYGFDIAGTPEYSDAPPLWVRYQRITSQEGVMICELDCIDIWRRLQELRIMGDAAGPSSGYERDTTVEGILTDLLKDVAVVSSMAANCDPDHLCTTEKPLIDDLETNMAIVDVIARAMSITKCVLRMRYDKLYSLYLANPTDANDDYIYELPLGSEHVFFANVWEQGLVLPNNAIFVDTLSGADRTTHHFSGSAGDPTSVSAFGYVTRIFADSTIRSNAEAGNRAAAMIVRLRNQQNQGSLRVPMNVGQELHDVLKVVDTRMNTTVFGRVGSITRRFLPDQNIYDLTMSLGAVTAPMDADGVPMQIRSNNPYDWAFLRYFSGQAGHSWLWYAESLDGITQGKSNGVFGTNPTITLGGDGAVLDTGKHVAKLAGATVVGVFQNGETVTGSVSGATGTLQMWNPAPPYYLIVKDITGTFTAADTVTGATSGATINGALTVTYQQSYCYIQKKITYPAAEMAWTQRRRFKTQICLDKNTLQVAEVVCGDPYTPLDNFGFRITGDSLVGITRHGGNETVSGWSINITQPDTLTLEAAFFPGKYVEFWVDDVYKGVITTTLPSGNDAVNSMMYAMIKNNQSECDNRVLKMQTWFYLEGK